MEKISVAVRLHTPRSPSPCLVLLGSWSADEGRGGGGQGGEGDNVTAAERAGGGAAQPLQGGARCGGWPPPARGQHGGDPQEPPRGEPTEEALRRPPVLRRRRRCRAADGPLLRAPAEGLLPSRSLPQIFVLSRTAPTHVSRLNGEREPESNPKPKCWFILAVSPGFGSSFRSGWRIRRSTMNEKASVSKELNAKHKKVITSSYCHENSVGCCDWEP